MTMQEFHALMKSDRSVAIAFSEDPLATLKAHDVPIDPRAKTRTDIVNPSPGVLNFHELSDEALDAVAGGARGGRRPARPIPGGIPGGGGDELTAYNYCSTLGCAACASQGWDHSTPDPSVD